MSNTLIHKALGLGVCVALAAPAAAQTDGRLDQKATALAGPASAVPETGAASAKDLSQGPSRKEAVTRKGPLRAGKTQTNASKTLEPARQQTPPPTLGEQLNAGLDVIFGTVKRQIGPQAPTLAQRLNSGVDSFSLSLKARAQPDARPLAELLQSQIDDLYLTVGRVMRPVPGAVGGVLNDLALSGPVLWPSPTLPKANAEFSPSTRLTLLQVWQVARTNDPTLRAARAALAAGREKLPQARSQLLPQVQLSMSRNANNLVREGQNTLQQPLTLIDRYPSANDTLSLRQPLLRMPQLIGIKQAQSVIQEVQAAYEQEEQEFSVRLAGAYFEVLLAQDTLEMIDSQKVFLEAALAAARRGFEAGVATRTDIDAAQAKLDLNAVQGLEVRQQLAQAQRQLQAYVSRPVGALAPLDPSKLQSLNPAEFSLDDWVQRAEENAPDIRRVRAQRQSVQLELNKVRASHLPTLDLVAQVQRSRSENTLSPSSQYQNNLVGVQLTVPIYNGGLANSQTRQVSAEMERLDEVIQALKQEVGVKVHREYRGVTEGLLRIRALEVAVRSADVALDSARKSVRAGVRSSVDVLNAEQQRMQTLRDLAQARYAMVLAMIKLQSLAGDTDEELLARVSAVLAP